MQAEDRAHRIGQKKEVLVLVLVSAGTIEQVILDRAQQKKEIDAKVIQVPTLLPFFLMLLLAQSDVELPQPHQCPSLLLACLFAGKASLIFPDMNTVDCITNEQLSSAAPTVPMFVIIALFPMYITRGAVW